jgi:hypothetical protein
MKFFILFTTSALLWLATATIVHADKVQVSQLNLGESESMQVFRFTDGTNEISGRLLKKTKKSKAPVKKKSKSPVKKKSESQKPSQKPSRTCEKVCLKAGEDATFNQILLDMAAAIAADSNSISTDQVIWLCADMTLSVLTAYGLVVVTPTTTS